MKRREELHPEIVRMRAQGMMFKDIGQALGISTSLAHDYYSDPDGSKVRARKERYAFPCVECGAKTNPGGTDRGTGMCDSCARKASKVWTPEAITTAVKRWADEHGGVPPTASQWQKGGEYWPANATVVATVGWRNAILAAGFDAFESGHYGRDGEYPEALEETVRLYRSGLSIEGVAREMGLAAQTVLNRLKRANEPRRSPWDWRRAA